MFKNFNRVNSANISLAIIFILLALFVLTRGDAASLTCDRSLGTCQVVQTRLAHRQEISIPLNELQEAQVIPARHLFRLPQPALELWLVTNQGRIFFYKYNEGNLAYVNAIKINRYLENQQETFITVKPNSFRATIIMAIFLIILGLSFLVPPKHGVYNRAGNLTVLSVFLIEIGLIMFLVSPKMTLTCTTSKGTCELAQRATLESASAEFDFQALRGARLERYTTTVSTEDGEEERENYKAILQIFNYSITFLDSTDFNKALQISTEVNTFANSQSKFDLNISDQSVGEEELRRIIAVFLISIGIIILFSEHRELFTYLGRN